MKIILASFMLEALRDPVCHLVSDCEILSIEGDGEIDGDPQGAEVALVPYNLDAETFHQLLSSVPTLRWVHSTTDGVDNLLFPEISEFDVVLTNASGIFDIPIAEMVLSYILTVGKRLPEFMTQQRAHYWNELRLRELRQLTVGIVGLGGIGSEVARLCQAFGMRVLGMRRHPRPHQFADEVLGPDQLHDLLAESDYVVISCPLTEETRGLIGPAELDAMAPEAWLINIARGPVVDQEALIETLWERRIGGACLDVFAEEPLPDDSLLWDLPNVIVTPHNAWSSPLLMDREAELFLDNLRRYLADELLQNVVDKDAGY